MAAVGGSIESITVKGRNFAVAADADANRSLGGFTNDEQSNGDGNTRIIKTRVPWSFDGLSLEIDDARGDQEYLQAIADGLVNVPITFHLASGKIYQGEGIPCDEIKMSTQNVTCPITFKGPQKLEVQS